MNEESGLLIIISLIVVLLCLIGLLNALIKEKRNPFIVEIEEWLKSTNRDYQTYFKIDFPKKYREFKEWKKK
ncbi:hypothetical protein VT98_10134 [Candidatus Electrothrix communis]|uniref:Uncharacterized protein n=1 Tax=Candidatus Electrothrix communis TaxID=1859133 RepID=A0A3S3QKG1_9BACT|nr:hypothetical protein VT98_10134 [Candidatus Electrothrix communis]